MLLRRFAVADPPNPHPPVDYSLVATKALFCLFYFSHLDLLLPMSTHIRKLWYALPIAGGELSLTLDVT